MKQLLEAAKALLSEYDQCAEDQVYRDLAREVECIEAGVAVSMKGFPPAVARASDVAECMILQTQCSLEHVLQRDTLPHMPEDEQKDESVNCRVSRLLRAAHLKCAELDDRVPADYMRKLIKDDVVAKLGADWEAKIEKELKASVKTKKK